MIEQTELFDSDKNIIKIIESNTKKEQITQLNQEKLKLALQITGVKIALSVQLSEDIIQNICIGSESSIDKNQYQNSQQSSECQLDNLNNQKIQENCTTQYSQSSELQQQQKENPNPQQLNSQNSSAQQSPSKSNEQKQQQPQKQQFTVDSWEKLKELDVTEITKKQFQDFVASRFIQKGYDKKKAQNYYQRILLACQILDKKFPLIILLGGTSGTGKSTVGSLLASRFGISTALSTDTIRQILRNFMQKKDCPPLFVSTYQAGQSLNKDNLYQNEKFIKKYFDESCEQLMQLSEQDKTIKGYKLQCKVVQERLEQVVDEYARRKDPIIIEGVHLTPNFMLKLMKKHDNVIPFTICIKDEKKHKERFAVRSKYMTLDKRHNKYIKNFMNIRLIQKWFLQKANQFLIPCINNVNMDKSLGFIHKTVLRYQNRVNSDQIIFKELKNAFPLYEEYNKATKNVWSSQQIKDMINSKANPQDNIQRYLNDCMQYQESLQLEKENEKKDQEQQQLNNTNIQQNEIKEQYLNDTNNSTEQIQNNNTKNNTDLQNKEFSFRQKQSSNSTIKYQYKNKSMTDDEGGNYSNDSGDEEDDDDDDDEEEEEEEEEEEKIQQQQTNSNKLMNSSDLQKNNLKITSSKQSIRNSDIKNRRKKVSFDDSTGNNNNQQLKQNKKVSFLDNNNSKQQRKQSSQQLKISKSFCFKNDQEEEEEFNNNTDKININGQQKNNNTNNQSQKQQHNNINQNEEEQKTQINNHQNGSGNTSKQQSRNEQKLKHKKTKTLFKLNITQINSNKILKPKQALNILKKQGTLQIKLCPNFSIKILKKYLEIHNLRVNIIQNPDGNIYLKNIDSPFGEQSLQYQQQDYIPEQQFQQQQQDDTLQPQNQINIQTNSNGSSQQLIDSPLGLCSSTHSRGNKNTNTEDVNKLLSDQHLRNSYNQSQSINSPRLSCSDHYSDQFDQGGVSIRNNTNYTVSEKISEESSLKIFNESDNYEQEREDEELDDLGHQVFNQIEEEDGYDSENEEGYDLSANDSDGDIMEQGLDEEDDVIGDNRDDEDNENEIIVLSNNNLDNNNINSEKIPNQSNQNNQNNTSLIINSSN